MAVMIEEMEAHALPEPAAPEPPLGAAAPRPMRVAETARRLIDRDRERRERRRAD